MDQDTITRAMHTIVFGDKTHPQECILLMGLPGSGKSFVSKYLHQKYGYTILSGENITYAIFGKTHCTQQEYREAYSLFHRIIPEILAAGYRIIIDATNLQYAHRKQIYDVIDPGIRVSGIFLTIDDNTAQKRIQMRGENRDDASYILSQCSDATFQKFKENVDFPTEDENFTAIDSDENIYRSLDAIFTSLS